MQRKTFLRTQLPTAVLGGFGVHTYAADASGTHGNAPSYAAHITAAPSAADGGFCARPDSPANGRPEAPKTLKTTTTINNRTK